MGVSIEIFKVHAFFNMITTPQAFFFYITLKRTLRHEKWYQFHFSTMICVGITTNVAFLLSTTVHRIFIKNNVFKKHIVPLFYLFRITCMINYHELLWRITVHYEGQQSLVQSPTRRPRIDADIYSYLSSLLCFDIVQFKFFTNCNSVII